MASVRHCDSPSVEHALGVSEVAHILGVHRRTIEHRKRVHKALRPLAAQREEKLHRIWRNLLALFTPEDTVQWLRRPVPVLENRGPTEVMAEDGGLDRVLDVVGRMSWGIPA